MLITPLFGTAEFAIAVSERADDGGGNNDEGPQVGVAKCAGYDVCEDHLRILVAPSVKWGSMAGRYHAPQVTLWCHGLLTRKRDPA